MTTYYVGPGGNNANDGLSWANRKLTLNGAEDIPVAAGDTVYVGPGTYRELLTVDVSGSVGSPITYIGDYQGTNTDGVGGVVRITGSDNDQTATRANCITATTKNYRTFQGFTMDTTTSFSVSNDGGTNWIIDKCFLALSGSTFINISGAGQSACTIQNCLLWGRRTSGINFTHTSTVDNTSHVVQNCIIVGAVNGVAVIRVGGVTVKNCLITNCSTGGVNVTAALSVGQIVTVNNCIIHGCSTGLAATTTAEFSENYNNLFGNTSDRTNVTAGANSLTYPPLFDTRWFFQLVTEGAGPNNTKQVISPFDLASFSQIVNVTGTSPTATDMRGTSAIGGVREWGALEYDSTLNIEAGGGGNNIAFSPFSGQVVR